MKTKQILGKGLVLIGGILSLFLEPSSLAQAKAGQPQREDEGFWQRLAFVGPAHIKEIKGRAECLNSNGLWVPLATGTALPSGGKFRALQNSEITFKMDRSDSLVHIKPYTVVRLSPLEKGMEISSLTGKEEIEGFVVREVRGQARFLGTDGNWTPIRVGASLLAGTQVETAASSILTLFYANTGLVLRVKPNSLVQLRPAPVTIAGAIQSNQNIESFSGIRTAAIRASE